jgi:hypothetical protein
MLDPLTIPFQVMLKPVAEITRKQMMERFRAEPDLLDRYLRALAELNICLWLSQTKPPEEQPAEPKLRRLNHANLRVLTGTATGEVQPKTCSTSGVRQHDDTIHH